MIIQPGYSRISVRQAEIKFYAPHVVSFGRKRHLKQTFRTAKEALAYAARFAARLERLLLHA